MSPPPDAAVNGYSGSVSAVPGETVALHVTGPSGSRYRVEVYRLGWYQGIGARLLACLPSCTTDKAAALTPPIPPPDPTTGYLDVGWPVTDVVAIGSTWVSGYYVAKLVITAGLGVGHAHFVPFIVREATPRSPILVQAGVNTWEAYTNYGGKSLYTYNSKNQVAAVMVSFNRPYSGSPVPWPFRWDYQLIRFLERYGYDVSYATDVDTARGDDALGARALVMVAGHDEYWSKEIRDAFDQAQATGTDFAFMGANTGIWQMRYGGGPTPDYRTMVEYRSATLDPSPVLATKTVMFRQLTPPRPECLLEGEQDLNGLNTNPVSPNYSVAPNALANPWFSGTGFTQSTQVDGVVGYEWDTAGQPGCPASQKLFDWTGAASSGQPSEADATEYTAPSGARTFDAGTLGFSWALDNFAVSVAVSPPLQGFVRNILNDLSGPS